MSSAKALAERSRLERAAELDDPPRVEAAAADPQAYPQRLKLPLTLAYCTLVAFNVAFAFGLRGPASSPMPRTITLNPGVDEPVGRLARRRQAAV